MEPFFCFFHLLDSNPRETCQNDQYFIPNIFLLGLECGWLYVGFCGVSHGGAASHGGADLCCSG